MRVHHLNCGTMNMPTAPMVCHALLVETGNGLVLVDTGYGSHDCDDPGRTGPSRHLTRPVLASNETAVQQVRTLGFDPRDVRHIVVTHFDVDHIGGLSDFPDARVHVTRAEAFGAVHSPSRQERVRYRDRQWAHGPHLVEHDADGEAWRGFAAAKELNEIGPGVVLVSLPGHTRGHACVAVDAGHRWVLHAGDAFYHRGTIDGSSKPPRALRLMENAVAFNRRQVHDNHARLAELHARNESDLLIVSAHDPELFRRAVASGSV